MLSLRRSDTPQGLRCSTHRKENRCTWAAVVGTRPRKPEALAEAIGRGGIRTSNFNVNSLSRFRDPVISDHANKEEQGHALGEGGVLWRAYSEEATQTPNPRSFFRRINEHTTTRIEHDYGVE